MEMQDSVSWILAAAGALALLAGIFGGGFELKELKLPKLSTASRAMSMIAGIVLLAIVTVPPLLQSQGGNDSGSSSIAEPETPGLAQPSEPPLPPEPVTVEVPSLVGLTRDAAVELIEAAGLVPGTVSTREIWAAHQRVYSQSPVSGEEVTAGNAVDLVIADSEFRYSAARSFTTEDDDLTATITYEVSLTDIGEQSQSMLGTFTIRRARIGSEEDDFDEIVDRLIDEPGYVELARVQDMEIASAWDIYDELGQDAQFELELGQINASNDLSAMGPAILLALAGMEVSFDVKALFAARSTSFDDAEQRLELQEGSGLLTSALEIEGPGSLADAGQSRRYEILRLVPGEEDYRRVGNVVYGAADGALRSLDLQYGIGDSAFYRLEIERQ